MRIPGKRKAQEATFFSGEISYWDFFICERTAFHEHYTAHIFACPGSIHYRRSSFQRKKGYQLSRNYSLQETLYIPDNFFVIKIPMPFPLKPKLLRGNRHPCPSMLKTDKKHIFTYFRFFSLISTYFWIIFHYIYLYVHYYVTSSPKRLVELKTKKIKINNLNKILAR